MIYMFTLQKLSIRCPAERSEISSHPIVLLNEVKHLYNEDSSLALRMTVSVIIYIIPLFTNYL